MKGDMILKTDEGCLFYELNYGEFFERTKGEVLSAEYRFNLKFMHKGYANLNDLYELLYLPKTEQGEVLGWAAGEGMYGCPWIDFKHELIKLDDGMECYIITMPFEPTEDYIYLIPRENNKSYYGKEVNAL